MPGDLEIGPRPASPVWASSIKHSAVRTLDMLSERSHVRPRWIRIFLAVSLAYLVFTVSRFTSTTVSVELLVPTGTMEEQSGHANPVPLQEAGKGKDEPDIAFTELIQPSQSSESLVSSASVPSPHVQLSPMYTQPIEPSPTEAEETTSSSTSSSTASAEPTFDVKPYLDTIVDPEDFCLPRMVCNHTISSRYHHLRRPPPASLDAEQNIKYFFALDLYQCVKLLPSLLGAVVEAIRFLGPQSCALSIVEGRSTDGTAEVLRELLPVLEGLGIEYVLGNNPENPREEGGDRIARLATIRNQALEPLIHGPPSHFADDPIIIFVNDIALCVDDILELVHQKVVQKADVVCSMDWNMGGKIFYDAWIARDIYGEPFFEVLQGWDWKYADNLFPNNKVAKRRFEQRKPIQVYACWNGMAVLNSAPFLKKGIRFRGRKNEDECEIGEPTYLAKDMWNAGFTRMLTVPSVGVAYNLKEGQECKDNYGTTHYNAEAKPPPEQGIVEEELVKEWMPQPQNMVCAPAFSPRWWVSTTS